MIEVSRFDGSTYYINPHQIEFIEVNPDTTIRLASGKKVLVKDSVKDIKKKIIDYYAQISKIHTGGG